MKRASPYLVLGLLLVVSFTLATIIQPRTLAWSDRGKSGDVLKMLLGDGRRMFANHFFERADISFHSGYYPSIFDRREPSGKSAMASGKDEHAAHDEAEHEKEMAFLGQPRDWIEAFGRHFRVTEHTHLAKGQEREILPWLRLSAELDPQRIDTYTVAAYWLREQLGKVKEAEAFLREGQRSNPDSYEILFELGRLYYDGQHDIQRARNVWQLALRKWLQSESGKEKPNYFEQEKIAVHLARLEEDAGRFERAIELLESGKQASPNPAALQKQIDELREKLADPASNPKASGY
jgi:tetratricopeptide (TPR) repeat protein